MSKVKIGVQMSTFWREIKKADLYEILRQCKQIGYNCFEVSLVPMTPENVATLQRAREELGIQIGAMSAHVIPLDKKEGEWVKKVDNLQENFDKIVSDCRKVDCNLLRIGIMPAAHMGSYEDVVAFAKEADMMAGRLKAEGIDMYYHTHHFEFGRYRGEQILDIVRNNTEHVGFELDTHWIQRGGDNPVSVIRRCAGRVRLLHLKDYRINSHKCSVEGLDTDVIEFAELGEGNLPIKECIEAGIESGCDFFFVEQDECYDRTPLECLKISHDNLVAMGYGDCF